MQAAMTTDVAMHHPALTISIICHAYGPSMQMIRRFLLATKIVFLVCRSDATSLCVQDTSLDFKLKWV